MGSNRTAWTDFPAIAESQERSLVVVSKLRDALEGISPQIKTIAVTGSLARLDAGESSDCDLIVVLHDGIDALASEASEIASEVYRHVEACGIPGADASGIYRQPTTARDLLNPESVGVIDESVDVFGKRMQLLIESRPVVGNDAFRDLTAAILDRYMQPNAESLGIPDFDYLLNDLIRYYRSYRVAKHWATSGRRDGWYLKQVKVQHTRLLTFATSVMLLGEYATDATVDRTQLLHCLGTAPLERVQLLCEKHGACGDMIFNAFSLYLETMADPQSRTALSDTAVVPENGHQLQPPAEYIALIENGRRMADALFDFMTHRYGSGEASFLRRLVL